MGGGIVSGGRGKQMGGAYRGGVAAYVFGSLRERHGGRMGMLLYGSPEDRE